ncbi:MAG: hypothetical protein MZU95_13630 [Desulfomicrobium escambiense]|nr:hypothetical protein [Desulfomicrobium escambiense]
MKIRPVKKVPSRQAILRAVTSSTAIETGQRVQQLERTLRAKRSRFRHLELAD